VGSPPPYSQGVRMLVGLITLRFMLRVV